MGEREKPLGHAAGFKQEFMTEQKHPWLESCDRFHKNVMPELESLGREIGLSAQLGNHHAQEIIRCYSLLRRSFDPMTLILLENSLTNYKEHSK